MGKHQVHAIFTKYGMYTVQDAHIKALVRFHFDSAGVRITTQYAQASWQMMTCLMNSCSAECLNNVRHSSDDHMVTNTSREVSEDGPLFLRILISRVVVDNRLTISFLCINSPDLTNSSLRWIMSSQNSIMRFKTSFISCSPVAKLFHSWWWTF